MPGLGELAGAVALTVLVAVPLAFSVVALLDAARRPQWAWALAGRRQVVWLAGLLFATISVIGGLVVASWYLARVRPEIAAAEQGRLGPR